MGAFDAFTKTTFTSREFNQYVTAAKRAADVRPVIITDRGEPAHVLLNYGAYQSLLGPELGGKTARKASIGDLLADPQADDSSEITFSLRGQAPERVFAFDD